MHKLQMRRVTPWSQYQLVKELYEASFPVQERISWPWMVWMSLLGQADFLAYYDGQDFAGFSYSLRSKTTYYLLFLAIPGQHQSKGYGRQILQEAARRAGHRPVFLVIEPLDESADNHTIRLKRLAFYEKNGYQLTDYLYYENLEVYQVLTNQTSADVQDFERLAKRIELSGMKIRLQEGKTGEFDSFSLK